MIQNLVTLKVCGNNSTLSYMSLWVAMQLKFNDKLL